MNSNYREINLEDGRPTVREMLTRFDSILEYSKKGDIIKIIHGYGSSGSGGKIRIELRKRLKKLYDENAIDFYVFGEKFSIFDENTRKLLNLAPELRKDNALDRHNNGITFLRV